MRPGKTSGCSSGHLLCGTSSCREHASAPNDERSHVVAAKRREPVLIASGKRAVDLVVGTREVFDVAPKVRAIQRIYLARIQQPRRRCPSSPG